MSIFYCHGCQRNVDKDFECCYELGDELVCETCYDAEHEKQKAYWEPLYKGEKLAGLIGPKEGPA